MVPGLMMGSTLPVWMIAQFMRQKASTQINEAQAISPKRALKANTILIVDETMGILTPTYLLGKLDFTYRPISLNSHFGRGRSEQEFRSRTAKGMALCLLTETKNAFWWSIWVWVGIIGSGHKPQECKRQSARHYP